eukprot:1324774-Amphidinium_carterae.1
MIVPNFQGMSEGIGKRGVERRIGVHCIDECWYSTDNNHGYFQTWEHAVLRDVGQPIRETDLQPAGAVTKSQDWSCSISRINLSTTLEFYRKMTPQKDTFKMYRCHAMVVAFRDVEDEEIIRSLVFEGQEHLSQVVREENPRGNSSRCEPYAVQA